MIEIDLKIAMTNVGIVPELVFAIITDGKFHRFKLKGDKAGTRNGWYVAYRSTYIIVVYGNWKTGSKYHWSSNNLYGSPACKPYSFKNPHISKPLPNLSFKNRTQYIWDHSKEANVSHPYLRSKKIKPYGIKQTGDNLIIPLKNQEGEITSLQFITPLGSKYFLKGGVVKGSFHQIGKLTSIIYIVEGYATGATTHCVTGKCVIVAFNTSNLMTIGQIIKTKFANSRIIFAADDDWKTKGNPGLNYAISAAESIQAEVTWPSRVHTNQGTDFNDLFHKE